MPQFELEQGSFRSQAVSDAQGRANRNQKSTTAPPPPWIPSVCTVHSLEGGKVSIAYDQLPRPPKRPTSPIPMGPGECAGGGGGGGGGGRPGGAAADDPRRTGRPPFGIPNARLMVAQVAQCSRERQKRLLVAGALLDCYELAVCHFSKLGCHKASRAPPPCQRSLGPVSIPNFIAIRCNVTPSPKF